MDITPPRDNYLKLLPGDILGKTLLNIPYPEILDKCMQFCNDKDFWIRKAANDTGNQIDDKFKDFFNEGNGNYINKYLRVLAYNNIAVPGNDKNIGSELYMCPAQMVKIGVDNKDKELIYYSLDKLVVFINTYKITDIGEFLQPLYNNYMINELKYLFSNINLTGIETLFPNYKWLFEGKQNELNNIMKVVKDRELIQRYKNNLQDYNNIINNKVPKDIYPFHYFLAKRYGYDEAADKILERISGFGPQMINGVKFDYELEIGDNDKALEIFRENPSSSGFSLSLMIYSVPKDDINLIKECYSLITEDASKLYFINSCLEYAYNESKVFEWALSLSDPNNIRIENYTNKSHTDFEGLYRMSRGILHHKRREFLKALPSKGLSAGYKPAIIEIFNVKEEEIKNKEGENDEEDESEEEESENEEENE